MDWPHLTFALDLITHRVAQYSQIRPFVVLHFVHGPHPQELASKRRVPQKWLNRVVSLLLTQAHFHQRNHANGHLMQMQPQMPPQIQTILLVVVDQVPWLIYHRTCALQETLFSLTILQPRPVLNVKTQLQYHQALGPVFCIDRYLPLYFAYSSCDKYDTNNKNSS